MKRDKTRNLGTQPMLRQPEQVSRVTGFYIAKIFIVWIRVFNS